MLLEILERSTYTCILDLEQSRKLARKAVSPSVHASVTPNFSLLAPDKELLPIKVVACSDFLTIQALIIDKSLNPSKLPFLDHYGLVEIKQFALENFLKYL